MPVYGFRTTGASFSSMFVRPQNVEIDRILEAVAGWRHLRVDLERGQSWLGAFNLFSA